MLRSQFLFTKNHSVTYNIITGEARHDVGTTTVAPLPPQQMDVRRNSSQHAGNCHDPTH